jgi:hypothetical protein
VKEKLVPELIRRDNKMYLGRSSSLIREEICRSLFRAAAGLEFVLEFFVYQLK